MSVAIVQQRLESYDCESQIEEEQALREITQEIILAALGRTDFFDQVGFQGGTSLRIFHALNRFSEDLDFALIGSDPEFQLAPYLKGLEAELSAYGYGLEIDDRSRSETIVQKAFLKDDSMGKLMTLVYRPRHGPMKKLRVKLEVDTRPPDGATYEMPMLDFPFPSVVRSFDLPSLFSGKLHALLCREYVKGRDWYDFIWYTARKSKVNHQLLSNALNQQGPWAGQNLVSDDAWCRDHLRSKISEINWKRAQEDVRRFLRPIELPSLRFWTAEFFLGQADKLLRA